MKANVILGKKQIILASLVLILGAAVYLNWQFADKNGDLDLTNQVMSTSSEEAEATGTTPEEATTSTNLLYPEDELTPEEALTAKDGLQSTGTPLTASDTETGAVPDSTASAAETAGGADAEGAAGTNSADDPKILGDAKLVDSKSIVDETYFAMAKLARTKSRDAAIETISTILDGEQLSEADKQAANDKALALTDVIESESRIENLVKAKGFDECVVYLTENGANVVVKTPGLDQDQATQIKNIVVSEGKIKGENISITEVN